jgi:hypothetical protein
MSEALSTAQRWRQRSLASVWHPCTQMKLHDSDVPSPLLAMELAQQRTT